MCCHAKRSEALHPKATMATVYLEPTTATEFEWYIDPFRQTASVYRADGTHQTLRIGDTLHGESILPGFELPVHQIFRPARQLQP